MNDVSEDAIPAGEGPDAPGAPGIGPTWCSSAKQVIGCAQGPSRVWFTVGGGIVNEVYYPRVDIPQIRDLGFIVSDGRGFWVEVKRLQRHDLTLAAPGVPAVRIEHRHERFRLHLRIVPAQKRDVLLVEVRLDGDEDLSVHALLAPHLGGTGHGNFAEVRDYRGRRVLWAEQGPFGLALAAVDAGQRDAWGRASAGYVGASDGWQDFHRNGALTWEYARAGPGNVALVGALPRESVLALGFGSSPEAAATLALSAVCEPFESAWDAQRDAWEQWHAACGQRAVILSLSAPGTAHPLPPELHEQFLLSAMVLHSQQDKTYPGTMVASLSVPWGNTRDERGGYHLVWPRDLVECAGGLLVLGAMAEACETLRYLIATQHPDGHWYQNQWLGGRPYWTGLQLDEAAFPVLLAVRLAEDGALDGIEIRDMVRRALGFIVRTGPASDQDRWEENAGVNSFTLAICIAALVAGAPWLETEAASTALSVADYWNSRLEEWTAVRDTALARHHGVSGYYIRVAPPHAAGDSGALDRALPIKNRRSGAAPPASEQVGVDFLQLVRFGLRRPDDPLVLDTLRVVDALLRAETPAGPCWYRYTGDGYGEHRDGSAYDGTGHGRPWPLLAGERGHYELAAGRDPLAFLHTMAATAGSGGMLPEQVWDADPIPEKFLFPGRPTGSAMPLAWAHSEFIKLGASRGRGFPVDRPRAVWERYRGERPVPDRVVWCEHAPVDGTMAGVPLLVCLSRPARVHWGHDGWCDVRDVETRDTGLGLHAAELDTSSLSPGSRVEFTFRDAAGGEWAGRDFSVVVRAS